MTKLAHEHSLSDNARKQLDLDEQILWYSKPLYQGDPHEMKRIDEVYYSGDQCTVSINNCLHVVWTEDILIERVR